MNWLRRSWFRHILTLRPTIGGNRVRDNWGGKIGIPHIDYDLDPPHDTLGWYPQVHFSHVFLMWHIGPWEVWVGIQDTN